jgi:magnesium-transporting ATPase (P-type)
MAICNPITDKDCSGVISNATTRASTLFVGIINFFFILGAIYFILFFIFSGMAIISSNGDEKKLSAAKTQLTNSILGFVIILSVYALLNLVAGIFNINLVNPTLPQLIK